MPSYITDPFELFGSSYQLTEIEKQQRIEDTIYKAQEIRITELEQEVNNLRSENLLLS